MLDLTSTQSPGENVPKVFGMKVVSDWINQTCLHDDCSFSKSSRQMMFVLSTAKPQKNQIWFSGEDFVFFLYARFLLL